MNQQWTEPKRKQFRNMFFTLKVMVLFFCTAPLFQQLTDENPTQFVGNINFYSIAIVVAIIAVVTALWVILTSTRQTSRIVSCVEIGIMYAACLTSILLSGQNTSYYKYIFLFIIVAYTMELGVRAGYVLAGVSSVTVLAIDLICYHEPGVNPFFQSDLALSAMFFMVAWILGYYVRVENEHIEKLQYDANMDGLTGLFNHRCFYDMFTGMFEESCKKKTPLSLLMLDIDYFKAYNDTFGHQKGDTALIQLAALMKEVMPPDTIICRYGGEEFAVVFQGLDQTAAQQKAEMLRQAVADREFEGQEMMPNHNLTVSIGVAERVDEDETITTIIERADAALYRAKFFRKNRVELYASIFDQFPHMALRDQQNFTSVKSVISIINSRDHYTSHHTERVVRYCEVFADYTELSEEDKLSLVYAAYLHDIGKINISKETLISDKRLTDEQWEEIRKHPVDSADIVSQLDGLQEVAAIVLQHHERFDGGGYPNGIKGEEILKLSRMLSLADSFDAMTAKRPYQATRTFEQAFSEIRACEGTQFDPELAEEFIDAIQQMM